MDAFSFYDDADNLLAVQFGSGTHIAFVPEDVISKYFEVRMRNRDIVTMLLIPFPVI